MKHLLVLLWLMSAVVAHGGAALGELYRATVSLPFVNSAYDPIKDADKFLNTRVANKQLINLALGQPFKAKVPKELILVLQRAAGAAPFDNAALVIYNTKTGLIAGTVATLNFSNVLTPDDPTKPSAALVTVSFPSMSNADFNTGAFTLEGSGFCTVKPGSTVPTLTFTLSGLRGQFSRSAPQLGIYASVMTSATIRATGKPLPILH